MAQKIVQGFLTALAVLIVLALAYRLGETVAPTAPEAIQVLPAFPATQPPPEPVTRVYTVKPGDTLSEIAEAETGSWRNYSALAQASGISNPDLIFPGQKIFIKGVDNIQKQANIEAIKKTEPDTMTTREAFLIAPLAGNDGEDLTAAHEALKGALLDAFGGFTITRVEGAWRDVETGKVYSDLSNRYTVACNGNGADRAKLETCARMFGKLAEQLSMYVCHANGEVCFLDTRAAPTPKAWAPYVVPDQGARLRAS